MERLYEDVYGKTHTNNEWDHHHVFARSTAKGRGGVVREFINQNGLVLPLLKTVHMDLHSEVEFPPLPSLSLMCRITERTKYMSHGHVYDRFLDIAEQFDSLGKHCANRDHREQSARIADNLARQSEFILAGQVRIVPLEAA